jgi:hypothetical protein
LWLFALANEPIKEARSPDGRHSYRFRNVAVTDWAAFIITVHAPVPVHAPAHPWNTAFLLEGVAVRVTVVPFV